MAEQMNAWTPPCSVTRMPLSNKLQKKAHHQHDEEERKEERNKRLRRRKNPAIFVRLNLLIMSDDEPVAILLAGLLTKKLKDALYWPTLAVVLCGMPGNNDKGVRTQTSDIRGWYVHVCRSIHVRWTGFILKRTRPHVQVHCKCCSCFRHLRWLAAHQVQALLS